MSTNFPTKEQLIKANRIGQADARDGMLCSFYNSTLQVAYTIGYNGTKLSECHLTTGYRFGDVPESGTSQNYTDEVCEFGVSCSYTDADEEGGKRFGHWQSDRRLVAFEGLLLPYTGSDGEPLVLPVGDGVDFD